MSPHLSRSPLDALGAILASVDAVRNLRALYVLLATFAGSGLLMAMARSALARDAGWLGAVEIGAALFTAFYGANAAGILLMDQARSASGTSRTDRPRAWSISRMPAALAP